MFNADFFPTPQHVIEMMFAGLNLDKKVVYDPEGGKGNIVDYAIDNGAKQVLTSELNDDLRTILQTKCKVIGADFLTITSDKISHVDIIAMNPPFSADEKHILHAWEIAPRGCVIRALCNAATFNNQHTSARKLLGSIIDGNGTFTSLGDCFSDAERKTGVEIGFIQIKKPGQSYETEFDGFFMDEDPEEEQANAIMSYNVVRDMVNRYVECVKLFDKQMNIGVEMNRLTGDFFHSDVAFSCTVKGQVQLRSEFKKDLQRSGWKYIFDKLNMDKYATQGLRDDINKFVEKQTEIPFTMKNIYHMLDIVVGTTGSRMDKAIEEVFDKLTTHYHDNRYNVEGWKTNSHYLMGEKFILPRMCEADKWHTGNKVSTYNGSYFELVEDMMKAMCYITGDNYDHFSSLKQYIQYRFKVYSNGKYVDSTHSSPNYDAVKQITDKLYKAGRPFEIVDCEPEYGQWFDWGYFRVKAYKKGTMHFEFKNKEVWGQFNQRVAKIKGYPLFEATKKQKAENKAANTSAAPKTNFREPTVLATFKVA
jgi:hypothetical protein